MSGQSCVQIIDEVTITINNITVDKESKIILRGGNQMTKSSIHAWTSTWNDKKIHYVDGISWKNPNFIFK